MNTRFTNGPNAAFYRVKVEYHGVGTSPPCVDRLVNVERNGKPTNYADSLQWTWAPATAHDALAKKISDKVPEFLDIGCITEQGVFALATPGFGVPNSIQGLFEEGEYTTNSCITLGIV